MFKKISSLIFIIFIVGFSTCFAEVKKADPFQNNFLFEEYKLFSESSYGAQVVQGEIIKSEVDKLQSDAGKEQNETLKKFYEIRIAFLKKEYKKSLDLIKKIFSQSKIIDKKYLSEAYNLKGLILTSQKKHKLAEDSIKKSLLLVQNNKERSLILYSNLILLYRLGGKSKLASDPAKKGMSLIKKDVNSGIFLNSVAGLKSENKLYDEAIKLFLRSYSLLKKKQDNLILSRLLNNLAFCYFLKGDLKKAEEYTKKSYYNYLYYTSINYYNTACILEKNKQEKKALFQYLFAFYMVKNKKLYYSSFNEQDRQVLKLSALKLGKLYAKQGDYNKAISAYDEAVNVFKELKDKKSMIEIYKIEIDVLNEAKKYEQAGIVTKKLRKLLGSKYIAKVKVLDVYYQILKEQRYLDEGFKYFQRGAYANSIRHFTKEEFIKINNEYSKYAYIAKPSLEDKARKEHLLLLRYVYKLEKDLALSSLNKCKGYYKQEKYKANLAHVFNHYAYLCLYLNEFEEARNYLKKSLNLFGNDLENKAALYNNLGFSMKSQGRFIKALKLFNQAKKIKIKLRQKEDIEMTYILRNIASVYGNQGDYTKAMKLYKQALRIDRLNSNQWGENKNLNNIANIYFIQGRYREAYGSIEHMASAGVDMYYLTEQNSLNNITLSHLLGKQKHYSGDFYKDLGDIYEGNISYLERASKYQRAGVILLNYSQLLQEQKKWKGSLEKITKAISFFEKIEDLEGLWSAYYLSGKVKEQMGKKKEASYDYEKAVKIIERMRSRVLGLGKVRALFGESKFYVYEAFIKILNKLKNYNLSFEISEKARARAFLDMIGQMSLKPKKKVSPKLVKEEKQIRDQINIIRQKIRVKIIQNKLKEVVKLKEKLNQKEKQYQAILNKISKLDEEFATLISVPTVKVSEISKLLDEKTALVEYFVTEDKTFMWIIRKGKLSFEELPYGNKVVEEKVFNLRKTLRMVTDAKKVKNVLNDMYEVIFKKSEKHLVGVESVGIIPHRSLNYLPWQALWDGKKYLIERFSMFELPSASILKFCRMKSKKLTGSLLALGNPELSVPYLSPLPGAEMEVKKIKKSYPNSKVLIKNKATEKSIKVEGKKYALIHLATHGQLNKSNPLYSRLYLAKSEKEDGLLQVKEIFNLDLKAQIIVLSACETGLQVGYQTQFPKGDEITGLSRAFIYAGTPRVIASLWKVADYPTAFLMEKFYKYLKSNPPVKSLQLAQIATMQRYGEPYFWAPFIIIGDWK